MPALTALLLIWALIRRVDVYEAFIDGAKESFSLTVRILPCMAAMLAAISALRASGLLDAANTALSPLLKALNVPETLLPLILLRPFSGSGAMALLSDVYASSGPDSAAGFAASVMLGSTETVFYVLALYFGSVGVKNTRYAPAAALAATLAGTVAALLLSPYFNG